MDNKPVIVIPSDTEEAELIFEETRQYLYLKKPIPEEVLNEKVYIYSCTYEKEIIGYAKIDEIIETTPDKVCRVMGINKNNIDGQKVLRYYGEKHKKCYVAHLYDITSFEDRLPAADLRITKESLRFVDGVNVIGPEKKLNKLIKSWDSIFSMDGEEHIDQYAKKVKVLKELKK